MIEEKRIMDFLGRGIQDGDVRGSHLGKILTYLKQTKTESLRKTISKLVLICGTGNRYIKENYIEGFEAFGIIEITSSGHDTIWEWVGAKAFEGKPTYENPKPPKETEKEKLDKKIEDLAEQGSDTPFTDAVNIGKKGYCKNCGKKISDGIVFCSAICLQKFKEKEK